MTVRGCGVLALATLALVALLSPPEAAAQEERIDSPYRWIERSLRTGAWTGYTFADRGGMRLGPASTHFFGGRLRARISSPLSLELNVGYGSSERLVIDPRLETGPAAVETLPLDLLVAEAAFQLALTGARTWNGLHPYVLFGGGLVRGLGERIGETFGPPELEDFRFRLGTAPAAVAGVGVEWVPGRIGVGIEARDQIWRLKTPDGFFRLEVLELLEDLGAEAPSESEWTHNFEVSGGLYWYF